MINVGVFKTRAGFTSVLYLADVDLLRDEEPYLLRIYAGNVSIGFDNISTGVKPTTKVKRTQQFIALFHIKLPETAWH